jgi:endonuclease YncB( thermonuclease family)/beta-lactam-binding protein with PASTA domain
MSCKTSTVEEPIILPDLTGLNKTQTIEFLDELDINYTFIDVINNDVRTGRFIRYEEGFQVGMEVEKDANISIYFTKYANALPDLSGLNIEEMNLNLSNFDFDVTYQEVVVSAIDPNTFISYTNELKAGDILPLGSPITILIAKAPDTRISLPDLRYLDEFEITSILDNLSLDYELVETENNIIPEGQFVSYGNNLTYGDLVEPSLGVTVYIAKFVNRLPDLTNKNQTQILSELSKLNIITEIRTLETNDIPEGLFVEYLNRESGQIVNNGAVVIVYIATPLIEVNRDLMISTYVEGTLYNKALELYNMSNEPIDLSKFTIEQYLDGSESSNISLELNGLIMPHDVYVIAHVDADIEIKNKANLLTDQLLFNGDDKIELVYYTGDVVDQIDRVIVLLNDITLSRKVSLTEPEPIFNYSSWDVYIKDNINPLGSHPTNFPQTFTYDPYYLSIPFPEQGGMVKVTFISNNDGDTAQFSPGFTGDDRVRFVGIDTNETGSGDLASAARSFVNYLLSNATEIYLQQDPSSGIRESYGRYLALVWADGVLVNYEIIKNGLAKAAYSDQNKTLAFNGVYLNTWMQYAESYAKTNRLGLWN